MRLKEVRLAEMGKTLIGRGHALGMPRAAWQERCSTQLGRKTQDTLKTGHRKAQQDAGSLTQGTAAKSGAHGMEG